MPTVHKINIHVYFYLSFISVGTTTCYEALATACKSWPDDCRKSLKYIIFSGFRPESTYFPDAARPAKTCFLATYAEKFYTTLSHIQRMTQIASLPSSASPRKVLYMRFEPSFFYGRGSYKIFLRLWRENKSLPDAQRPGNTCFRAADQKNSLFMKI